MIGRRYTHKRSRSPPFPERGKRWGRALPASTSHSRSYLQKPLWSEILDFILRRSRWRCRCRCDVMFIECKEACVGILSTREEAGFWSNILDLVLSSPYLLVVSLWRYRLGNSACTFAVFHFPFVQPWKEIAATPNLPIVYLTWMKIEVIEWDFAAPTAVPEHASRPAGLAGCYRKCLEYWYTSCSWVLAFM